MGISIYLCPRDMPSHGPRHHVPPRLALSVGLLSVPLRNTKNIPNHDSHSSHERAVPLQCVHRNFHRTSCLPSSQLDSHFTPTTAHALALLARPDRYHSEMASLAGNDQPGQFIGIHDLQASHMFSPITHVLSDHSLGVVVVDVALFSRDPLALQSYSASSRQSCAFFDA